MLLGQVVRISIAKSFFRGPPCDIEKVLAAALRLPVDTAGAAGDSAVVEGRQQQISLSRRYGSAWVLKELTRFTLRPNTFVRQTERQMREAIGAAWPVWRWCGATRTQVLAGQAHVQVRARGEERVSVGAWGGLWKRGRLGTLAL